MSTRSPMNKRTQEQMREGKKSGVARKSAGSAKPARPAAASVRVVSSSAKTRRKQAERGESLAGLSREEKRARKREERAREDRVYTASTALMKQDPEYIKNRRVFWAIMAVGIVFIVLGWVVMSVYGSHPEGTPLIMQYGFIGVAYVAIIASFIYDFVKIRPLRNESRAKAEGLSEGRLNALLERTAAEEDARRAEKKSRKDKKR